MTRRRFIDVIELASGKVVKTLDVTGKPEAQREKVLMGLLRQMDLERYSAVERALSPDTSGKRGGA